MLDYAKMYGLHTVVFRHSSIFGGRQFSTIDQGWIGWFTQKAIDIKRGINKESFTISGTGKQVRDVLFVDDLTNCYFKATDKTEKTSGKAFNIRGGIDNSLSLLELFQALEQELNNSMKYEKLAWRQSDQKVFVANIDRATQLFNWQPKIDKLKGIRKMIAWVN